MSKHGLVSEATDKEKIKLYKNVFRVKDFDKDYSLQEVRAIEAIVYNPTQLWISELYKQNKVILYGSHVYRGNVLAGDIDVMEIISLKDQAKALQWTFNNFLYNPDFNFPLNSEMFLGDIKCGIVPKFKSLATYIGTYENGKIKGYNYEAVKYSFSLSPDLADNKLTIPKKIQSKADFIEYLKIYDLAHTLFTQRWKPEEIIDGYITNEDGSKYTLNMAVYDSKLTKYDCYMYVNNTYIEITNTFMVESDQSKKKNTEFQNGVKLNMLIQYYVKDNKLKALKRLYALMRMNKNINMALLLHDFTQRSLVGKYNQIINDLKVFIFILENYSSTFATNPNLERPDMLSTHIGSIVDLIIKMYNPYNKKLEEINEGIKANITRTKVLQEGDPDAVKTALEYCEKIIEYFSSLIDKDCGEFIKINNINFQDYL
jgi:hypothetical protein